MVQEQKKEEKWGVAHIYSSTNNTIVHITDVTGSETIARYSGGAMTDKDREGGMPFPSMIAARKAAEESLAKGLSGVQDSCINIRVRARGSQYSRNPGMGKKPTEWGLN